MFDLQLASGSAAFFCSFDALPPPRTMFSDFQLLVVASPHAQLPSFAPSEQCMGQVSAVSRRAGGGLPPVHGPQCFGMFVVFDCGMSDA